MRSVLCTFWFLAKIFGGVMYGRVLEMCRPKCIFFTTVSFFLTSVVVVCVQSFDETRIFFHFPEGYKLGTRELHTRKESLKFVMSVAFLPFSPSNCLKCT